MWSVLFFKQKKPKKQTKTEVFSFILGNLHLVMYGNYLQSNVFNLLTTSVQEKKERVLRYGMMVKKCSSLTANFTTGSCIWTLFPSFWWCLGNYGTVGLLQEVGFECSLSLHILLVYLSFLFFLSFYIFHVLFLYILHVLFPHVLGAAEICYFSFLFQQVNTISSPLL